MKSYLFSLTIYLIATLSGAMVLVYPFLLTASALPVGFGSADSSHMPMLMTFLLGLCLLVLLFEAQGPMANTKLIALLGVLVAINSALRFIDITIPGPGGFTPIFFLIIMVGYVFGGRVGFLMGALTMLVSALVTGGVGPWLPAQMFTAGWVGMSTPAVHSLVSAINRRGIDKRALKPAIELFLLAAFGLLWGFLYGAIMNLWQWPFMAGPLNQSYRAGLGLATTLQHYLAFYLVTSLVWDAAAGLGNVLLILAFGVPTLRALRRFKQRFEFKYMPETGPRPHSSEGSTG